MFNRQMVMQLLPTLGVAGLITFLLCQRHGGFLVVFQAAILILACALNLWPFIKNRAGRPLLLAKLGIWLLSMAVIVVSHAMLAAHTRAKAQGVVDAINGYYQANGAYPSDLGSIGYLPSAFKDEIGMGGYHLDGENPTLFYASTYIAFATEHYDFNNGVWLHSD